MKKRMQPVILLASAEPARNPESASPRPAEKSSTSFFSVLQSQLQNARAAGESIQDRREAPRPEEAERRAEDRRAEPAPDRSTNDAVRESRDEADSVRGPARAEKDSSESSSEKSDLKNSDRAQRSESSESSHTRSNDAADSARADRSEGKRQSEKSGAAGHALHAHALHDPLRTSRKQEKATESAGGLGARLDAGLRASKKEGSVSHLKAEEAAFDFARNVARALSDKTSNISGTSAKPAKVERQAKSITELALAAQRVSSDRDSHEPAKSTKDRPIVLHLERDKWDIQEMPRRESREFGQSDARSHKGELKADQKARLDRSPEKSTAIFSELLKPQIAPADKEKLTQDTKDLFNQLVQKARVNFGADGSSQASIRLRPEQLGSVTLNLKVHGQVIEAKMVVENESVRKLVKEEMEMLQKELKRQGFSVDAIEIRVREPQMESSSSFNPETAARFQNDREGQFREQNRAPESVGAIVPAAASVEAAAAAYESAPAWEGELNIAV